MAIRKVAILVLFGSIGLAGLASAPSRTHGSARAAPARQEERTVYLAGALADENLIVQTAAIAAGDPAGVLLFADSPERWPLLKAFLDGYRPTRALTLGAFPKGVAELKRRLGIAVEPAAAGEHEATVTLWKKFFPQA